MGLLRFRGQVGMRGSTCGPPKVQRSSGDEGEYLWASLGSEVKWG